MPSDAGMNDLAAKEIDSVDTETRAKASSPPKLTKNPAPEPAIWAWLSIIWHYLFPSILEDVDKFITKSLIARLSAILLSSLEVGGRSGVDSSAQSTSRLLYDHQASSGRLNLRVQLEEFTQLIWAINCRILVLLGIDTSDPTYLHGQISVQLWVVDFVSKCMIDSHTHGTGGVLACPTLQFG